MEGGRLEGGGGVKLNQEAVKWWLGCGGGGGACDECDGAERGDTSGAVNSHTPPFATEVREPHVWRGGSEPLRALTLSTPFPGRAVMQPAASDDGTNPPRKYLAELPVNRRRHALPATAELLVTPRFHSNRREL